VAAFGLSRGNRQRCMSFFGHLSQPSQSAVIYI
jgi:hypothetical protein